MGRLKLAGQILAHLALRIVPQNKNYQHIYSTDWPVTAVTHSARLGSYTLPTMHSFTLRMVQQARKLPGGVYSHTLISIARWSKKEQASDTRSFIAQNLGHFAKLGQEWLP